MRTFRSVSTLSSLIPNQRYNNHTHGQQALCITKSTCFFRLTCCVHVDWFSCGKHWYAAMFGRNRPSTAWKVSRSFLELKLCARASFSLLAIAPNVRQFQSSCAFFDDGQTIRHSSTRIYRMQLVCFFLSSSIPSFLSVRMFMMWTKPHIIMLDWSSPECR